MFELFLFLIRDVLIHQVPRLYTNQNQFKQHVYQNYIVMAPYSVCQINRFIDKLVVKNTGNISQLSKDWKTSQSILFASRYDS